MSQVVLTCPHCSMRLGANSAPAEGTMLTCPTCSQQFAAPAQPAVKNTVPQQAAPSPARPTKKPPQVQKPPQLQKPAVQPQALASQLTPIPSQPASLAPLTPAYQAPVYPKGYGVSQSRGPFRGLIISLSAAAGGLVLIVVLVAVGVYIVRSIFPLAQNVTSGSLPPGFEIPAVKGLTTKPHRAPETLDDCIADIRISEPSFGQVYQALIMLQNMEPVAARRDEVAGLLDPLLNAKDSSVRNSAFRTLKKWGTQKNVATLSRILQLPNRADRRAAMDALGSIPNSVPAAEALAKQMLQEDDRYAAARALEQMGPLAEDIVWPHVPSTDQGLRSAACSVLGKVGTKKSLPRLKELIRSETDVVRRSPLSVAESDIERRLDKTEGSGGIFD